MKYFSMFSGIGGFELGIQKVCPEWECVGHSEIDKYADKIYSKHFGSKNYGDATKINPDDLPDIDMICGGFPCQSFSIAGKRGGIKYDTRGTLFREIVRIAETKRPEIIFLENVKGLLSSQEGWDFQIIQDCLVQLGYQPEWEVLNTKNFGLPQNRERVFIVGYLGKRSGQKVFPIGQTSEIYNEKRRQGGKVVNCIDSNYHKGWLDHGQRTMVRHRSNESYKENNIAPALRQGDKQEVRIIHNVYGGFNEKEPRVFEDYSPAIRTPKGGGHLPLVVDKIAHCLNTEDSRKFKLNKSSQQKSNLINQKNSIRRLTPIECERLQGFPDNWTEGISDSQRYKCLGNAVSVPVISIIAERIKEVFNK